MTDARLSTLLAYVAELERRDDAAAADLVTLEELDGRAAAIRARATAVHDELEGIPLAVSDLDRLRHEAREEADTARSQLAHAEERLAGLERSRRKRVDETDRARREVTTARELLADAEARSEQLDRRSAELAGSERALREEAETLVHAARRVAGDLEPVRRIGDATRTAPGETLEELEEWGALVRSGLLVARGTVVAERERIVAEANALGEAASGESLGVVSVGLVRRRLEHDSTV